MFNFDVGLSGLRVAQRAIELIGTNIVNAGTEGYHRQSLKIVPREYGTMDKMGLGGAEVVDVTRSMDRLLEREILYQQPLDGQVSQELSVLELIERSIGGVGSQGIADTMGGFFNAMGQLAGQPDSLTLRQQVVWIGQELCTNFNQLSQYLRDLSTSVVSDAQSLLEQANSLIERIATQNQEIRMLELRGGNTNILKDQRDQAICELAKIADIQIDDLSSSAGMVNVSAYGIPVVTGSTFMKLQSGLNADDKLGVTVLGGEQITTDLEGGQVAGLAALKNGLISDIQDGLDLLAQQVMQAINAVHAQGIGESGSFSQLTGAAAGEGTRRLADLEPPITAGMLSVRVIDSATGAVTVHDVTVSDPTTMTMNDLVADLNAVPGLGASLSGWRVYLQADAGKQFDFLATSLPGFAAATWTAGNTADVDLTGTFSGLATQTFDVRVEGSGEVGVTEGLSLAVYDDSGNLLRRLNVGLGYAAGDKLGLDNGLSLSLGSGHLVDANSFSISAKSSSDTAGVLGALGLNAFFSGHSASDMAVREEVLANPNLVATGGMVGGSDNLIATAMARVGETSMASLGGQSAVDYFAHMSTSVGQEISLRQARQASIESVVQQLTSQRDAVGGVDVNDEAAKLILFERMFQAAAKFMSTQSRALEFLMDII